MPLQIENSYKWTPFGPFRYSEYKQIKKYKLYMYVAIRLVATKQKAVERSIQEFLGFEAKQLFRKSSEYKFADFLKSY